MEKIKIERIFRGKQETKFGEKDKLALKIVGGKYIDNKGQPAWVSTFKTKGTEHWKEGDEVEITITENKGFFNFDIGDVLTLESLDARLKKVEGKNNEPEVQIDDTPADW